MPTIHQALLLGAERLNTPPAIPHPALHSAWSALDWSGAKEAALLDAAALLGSARVAGAPIGPALHEATVAPPETQPGAPARAAALVPQLLESEGRPLLAEWLELCAARGAIVPPLLLPRLLETATTADDRAALARVIGERGRWLAHQNPAWTWVHAAVATEPNPALWEDGSEEERLGCLRALRATDPAQARALVEKTWADDPPEFRSRAIEHFRIGLSLGDESFLTAALRDRRKDVRSTAQALLATLPGSGLSTRMRQQAERLLVASRTLLGRRFEVNLPAAFDPAWKADAIEEKPPAGVGEKAFWAQQILALVPVRHWAEKFEITSAAVIEIARKSADWVELLLGAWYRSALLHGDAEACATLLKPVTNQPKFLPPGVNQADAIAALLDACTEADRWRFIAETELAWAALKALRGTPSPAQAEALLHQVAPAIRDGFNPGGSPAAVAVARFIPPSLRDKAVRLLTRDNGLSKPAEAFMQAIDLRAAMHAAFASS